MTVSAMLWMAHPFGRNGRRRRVLIIPAGENTRVLNVSEASNPPGNASEEECRTT
ncbi:MAG: hypothetical protein WBC70_03340 [Candidatus Aminicenantales bacterium]